MTATMPRVWHPQPAADLPDGLVLFETGSGTTRFVPVPHSG